MKENEAGKEPRRPEFRYIRLRSCAFISGYFPVAVERRHQARQARHAANGLAAHGSSAKGRETWLAG